MNQYEAMFVFDPTFGSQFESCEAEIRRLMERAGAEIIFCKKWDERRLSFKIKGRKRGLYVLTYFRAPADRIGGLERDCQIAENVLRVLVLRADHVTPDMMEKAVITHGQDTTNIPAPGAKPRVEGEPDLGFDLFEDDARRERKRGRRPAVVEAGES